jgi:translation initiation factor IF-2
MATPPKETSKQETKPTEHGEARTAATPRTRNPNLRRVSISGSDGGSGRPRRTTVVSSRTAPANEPSAAAAAAAAALAAARSAAPVDPRIAAGLTAQPPQPPTDPRAGMSRGGKPAARSTRSAGTKRGAAEPKRGADAKAGTTTTATGTRAAGTRTRPAAAASNGTATRGRNGSATSAAGAARTAGTRNAVAGTRARQGAAPKDPRRGTPAASRPTVTRPATAGTAAPAANAAAGQATADQHKRPTRDSLQGEHAPAAAAGGARRRVVIDSQASRRAPGGGPGGPAGGQPGRRPRRGRRRRGTYDDEAESRGNQSMTAPSRDLIRVNSGSTVKDVAEYFGVRVPDIVKKLMELGEMKNQNQTLSDDTIEVLASELGRHVEIVSVKDAEPEEEEFHDEESELVPRPPVVTIMGHVDHGKTSLLDAIRQTHVTAGEAGGITQAIGAYQVPHGDAMVTFIDTPGHEAFTAMRARGAKVTDLAVIVVAADDGVKPQTEEAIDHAKEAGVPMLVAVNKIDKPGADPVRVRTEMTALGLQPVDWGGEVDFVDVSAKTKEGLDELLDTIVTEAELLELRANPNAPASGSVIESKLDPGRGAVVTILVARGTLHVGDALLAGSHWGRVRAMQDFMGERIESAGPGVPVEVLGFDGVPEAGEHMRVVENERRARQLATELSIRLKSESMARRSAKRVSLEDIFSSGTKELNLVLKADVAGSAEAIQDEISKLPQDEVSVNIIRHAVGGVTESDVMLAAASQAVIMAFNVRPVGDARALAEREGVEIRSYSVIYRAIDELRQAMQGMLAPEQVEEQLGSAEVRQIFRASRVGTIAGTRVTEGKLTRGAKVRLVRDGTVVHEAEIASLRRFNDDAREVTAGFDCGVVLKDYADIKEGDVMEAYVTREVERELS